MKHKIETLNVKEIDEKKGKKRIITSDDEKRPRLYKILERLNELYDFRYNTVRETTEYSEDQLTYLEVDEMFINSIVSKFKLIGVKTYYSEIEQLLNSDLVDKYDPFLKYFNNLPKWDASMPSQIDRLVDTIKTDDQEYFKSCFKKWIIALVACATLKDEVNHQMIVISGKQGLGKSTWINKLVPKELSNYHYSGSINPNNKDTYVYLAESLLINLDELTNMNKKETTRFKEIITQGTINIRKAYARMNKKLTRRASFIGSINETEFLYDLTGSRRFLCFIANEIDYNNDIDIDLVYAEAKFLLDSGEKYHFDQEDIQLIDEKNERFRVKSPLEVKLLDFYSPTVQIEDPSEYGLGQKDIELKLRPISILMKLFPNKYKHQPPSAGELKTIGSILTKIGFNHKYIKGRKYYELHSNVPRMEGRSLAFGVDHFEENGKRKV